MSTLRTETAELSFSFSFVVAAIEDIFKIIPGRKSITKGLNPIPANVGKADSREIGTPSKTPFPQQGHSPCQTRMESAADNGAVCHARPATTVSRGAFCQIYRRRNSRFASPVRTSVWGRTMIVIWLPPIRLPKGTRLRFFSAASQSNHPILRISTMMANLANPRAGRRSQG